MASHDPFRAISGQKRQRGIDELFATAQPHMDQLFSAMNALGLPKGFGRALEFGCGAGRFLRHLELKFREVWGVDVSDVMVQLASKYNPRCNIHLNTAPDLGVFPSDHFDLIYSFLVLQHLPNKSTIELYLREFVRVLAPNGLLAFQLPNHLSLRWRLQPRRRAYRLLNSVGLSAQRLQSWNLLPMSVIAIPEHSVQALIRSTGASISRKDVLGANDGIMYYCTKQRQS